MVSPRTKNVALNALGSYFVKGLAILVSFLVLPAYIRYFNDNAVLGLWYTLLSVINWVFLCNLGIGHGLRNKLTVALAEGDVEYGKQVVSSAYAAIALSVTLVGAAAFLLAGILPWNTIFGVPESLVDAATLLIAVRIVLVGLLFKLVMNLINAAFFALQWSALDNLCTLVANVLILAYVIQGGGASTADNLISLSWVHVICISLPYLVMHFVIYGWKLREYRPNPRFVTLDAAKAVLSVGLLLMWLTLVASVVFTTHALLISLFLSPDAVVEYQVYFKLFNGGVSVAALVLVPIWSAVTKARAEGDVRWVAKMHKLLVASSFAVLAVELAALPALQPVIDVWLGGEAIDVDIPIALLMCCYGFVFYLHQVNVQFENGLEYLKVQSVGMGLAALLMVPLSWAFVQITGSWVGVVLGSTLSVLPYEIASPVFMARFIGTLECVPNNNRRNGD